MSYFLITVIFQILYLAWIISEANEDSPYILAGKGIFHRHELIARIAAGSVMLFLYAAVSGIFMPDAWIFKTLGVGVLMAVEYWIVFNLFVNVFINQDKDYIGTTSTIDRWFRDRPQVMYFLQFFLVTTGICLYFYNEIRLAAMLY